MTNFLRFRESRAALWLKEQERLHSKQPDLLQKETIVLHVHIYIYLMFRSLKNYCIFFLHQYRFWSQIFWNVRPSKPNTENKTYLDLKVIICSGSHNSVQTWACFLMFFWAQVLLTACEETHGLISSRQGQRKPPDQMMPRAKQDSSYDSRSLR